MSRKFYVVTGIITSLALLLCMIKSITEKQWVYAFCNLLYIAVNIQAFVIYNRAEVLKDNIYKRLDEHEKRNNESEN